MRDVTWYQMKVIAGVYVSNRVVKGHLGSVWNPGNTRERKEIPRKMIFLCLVSPGKMLKT